VYQHRNFRKNIFDRNMLGKIALPSFTVAEAAVGLHSKKTKYIFTLSS